MYKKIRRMAIFFLILSNVALISLCYDFGTNSFDWIHFIKTYARVGGGFFLGRAFFYFVMNRVQKND